MNHKVSKNTLIQLNKWINVKQKLTPPVEANLIQRKFTFTLLILCLNLVSIENQQ